MIFGVMALGFPSHSSECIPFDAQWTEKMGLRLGDPHVASVAIFVDWGHAKEWNRPNHRNLTILAQMQREQIILGSSRQIYNHTRVSDLRCSHGAIVLS